MEANKHVFNVLKEALNYTSTSVEQNDDGTIHLFFDMCCEFDIDIKNYTDLRC